jgi:membrane protein implicated in regulation of membrane protease activity
MSVDGRARELAAVQAARHTAYRIQRTTVWVVAAAALVVELAVAVTPHPNWTQFTVIGLLAVLIVGLGARGVRRLRRTIQDDETAADNP